MKQRPWPFFLFGTVSLVGPAAVPLPLAGQEITGVVLSAEDRSPIHLAMVRLMDLETGAGLTSLTDPQGFFRIRPPGRVNRLEVSALGYLAHVDTVYMGTGTDSLVLEVRLGVDAIPMDPLLVVGSRRPPWESTEPEHLWEFFERREMYGRRGPGSRFFDRQELAERIGEVGSLSRLESLWPIQSHRARFARAIPRRPGVRSTCETLYYVDGAELRLETARGAAMDALGWAALDPFGEVPWDVSDIAAVELYYGPTIPAEFITRKEPVCRVISIWTDRPEIPEDAGKKGPSAPWILVVVSILALLGGF